MTHPVLQRIRSAGPKRILSLDGGGIRGAVTLGFLVELEQHLRDRHKDPNFLLRDYFDLIGGTSTGSIIATAISIGMPTEQIREEYEKMGESIFEKPAGVFRLGKRFRQLLWWKSDPATIEEIFRKFFGERTLDSTDLTNALCIIAKRVDTASTWLLHNNPAGRYFDRNGKVPLWRIVRSSTAAPTYFPPKTLKYSDDPDPEKDIGAFIDGGVSMFNNPSLALYLMATLKGYHFNWATGADKLLLCSIGTGTYSMEDSSLKNIESLGNKNALFWGKSVPNFFMRDTSDFAETLLQTMSDSPTKRVIDRELGDLSGDSFTGRHMLHYLRYNAELTDDTLAAHQQLTQSDSERYPPVADHKSMMAMDAGQNVFHLSALGARAAKVQLTRAAFDAHFPGVFDVGGETIE